MTRTLQQLEPYLQGHWKLDTDFKDHSQNSNDGTPTAIEWKSTRRGLKPSFNGSSSFINCGNHSSLNIINEITISSWINTKTLTGASRIVDKTGAITDAYLLDRNNDKIRSIMKIGGIVKNVSSSITIESNKWYHVVSTYNRSELVVYINGIVSSPTSATGDIGTNLDDIYIGASSIGAYFNDIINDTRIYNTALTADEVLNLYNSTKHRPGIIPAERSYTHQLGIKPEDGLVLGFDGHTKNADGTFQDLSGNSNHGTNYGTSRDVGYFGEVRDHDGSNDYISFGNIGNTKSIEMLVEPDTTTEYLLDLNATATIDINAGTIRANNVTTPTIYRDAVVQTSISDDVLSHIIITTGTNVNATAVNLSKIAANYLDGKVKLLKLYSTELSLVNVKSKFNLIATLPLFHINFKDYPDNEDVSWTDNEPIPYSTMQVGSNGTFKIDDDQLVCSENTSTLTLRNNHEFDGSEYITIDIDGTKYSGTGTITQGTVTVSITQGSRFITVAMSDTDVLDSIDIQFRAEVS